MFRSLRLTIEYTPSCFKYALFQRVKENLGNGWIASILDKTSPLKIFEEERRYKIALELGKSWCYIEIINPLLFPSYVRLNGVPYMIKKEKNLIHKQVGRTVIISRLSNTKHQNYYITVRSD